MNCPHDGGTCHHDCPVDATTKPRHCYRAQRGMVLSDPTPDPARFNKVTPISDLLSNAVNHPAHYGGDTVYEVIKCLDAWGLDADAYLFQVVKYVSRAGKKEPGSVGFLKDLKKAKFYLDRRIDRLEAADGS